PPWVIVFLRGPDELLLRPADGLPLTESALVASCFLKKVGQRAVAPRLRLRAQAQVLRREAQDLAGEVGGQSIHGSGARLELLQQGEEDLFEGPVDILSGLVDCPAPQRFVQLSGGQERFPRRIMPVVSSLAERLPGVAASGTLLEEGEQEPEGAGPPPRPPACFPFRAKQQLAEKVALLGEQGQGAGAKMFPELFDLLEGYLVGDNSWPEFAPSRLPVANLCQPFPKPAHELDAGLLVGVLEQV